VGITFSCLSASSWIDYLGFITEGKLATIFIKTFSWGFPTGRSFYFINSAPSKIKEKIKEKTKQRLVYLKTLSHTSPQNLNHTYLHSKFLFQV
jgi:hypothetical protein